MRFLGEFIDSFLFFKWRVYLVLLNVWIDIVGYVANLTNFIGTHGHMSNVANLNSSLMTGGILYPWCTCVRDQPVAKPDYHRLFYRKICNLPATWAHVSQLNSVHFWFVSGWGRVECPCFSSIVNTQLGIKISADWMMSQQLTILKFHFCLMKSQIWQWCHKLGLSLSLTMEPWTCGQPDSSSRVSSTSL